MMYNLKKAKILHKNQRSYNRKMKYSINITQNSRENYLTWRKWILLKMT